MREVLLQEWRSNSAANPERITRYSLHMNEEERDAFAAEYKRKTLPEGRTVLEPVGRSLPVGVAEEVYERVRGADDGLWYEGPARWGGQTYDLGSQTLPLD